MLESDADMDVGVAVADAMVEKVARKKFAFSIICLLEIRISRTYSIVKLDLYLLIMVLLAGPRRAESFTCA